MEHLVAAFVHLLHPTVFASIVAGVTLGLVVGAIPGLNDSITLAVLVPITFSMSPDIAFPILVGVYCAACYGGSIPAILLKIPGTASSVVTTLDGYPMAQQGKAGQALGISTYSSVFGGLSSSVVLMFFAPLLARYALRFGPPEYFALALLGMSTVVGMCGEGQVLKSLMSGVIGLLIATIGFSPQTGYPRFTFDIAYLYEGVPFIPLLIGLFGVTSVLELAETVAKERWHREAPANPPAIGSPFLSRRLMKRLLPTWIKSSVIGNIIGILPGAGMIMAIYFAYDQAVRSNKDKKFGTGVPEGVAAPETANNAVVASSMVPLLSLGIPGNSTSALFLGALMIQGLRPGPSLFTESADVAYLIVVAFFVGNVIMGPLGLLLGRLMSRLVFKLPRELLAGIITLLCLTGSFAVGSSMFDVGVAIVFGLVGFAFNKLKLPHSPLILAIVLGSMMERGLYQSLVLSKGSVLIFVQRPISLVLILGTVFFTMTPVVKMVLRNRGRNQVLLPRESE